MSTKAEIPVQTDFSSEIQEWIEAFDDVIVGEGPEQGAELLDALRKRARQAGVNPPSERALEKRIEALIRWNAMAMVHGQNKKDAGIGGHISTYSSLATLLEVGFNH